MREALNSLMEQEREQEQLRIANRKLEEQLTAFLENIKIRRGQFLKLQKIVSDLFLWKYFEAKMQQKGMIKHLLV